LINPAVPIAIGMIKILPINHAVVFLKIALKKVLINPAVPIAIGMIRILRISHVEIITTIPIRANTINLKNVLPQTEMATKKIIPKKSLTDPQKVFLKIK
jgi:hypothetical protein